MTPGDPVAITRGARVQFRAVVERIAWPGGDIILTDVRRLLDFGARSGDLRENPAANLRPIRERPEDKFRALDDYERDQRRAQIDAAAARHRAAVAMAEYERGTDAVHGVGRDAL